MTNKVNRKFPHFWINFMDHRQRVFERFAECYGTRSADLVKTFGLDRSTVSNWKTGKRPVPRERLKKAVDEFHVRWDWLLDGKPPKFQAKRYWTDQNPLDDRQITIRFLDLFNGVTDTEIAHQLDVSPTAVHYMREGSMKVPWEKISLAVDRFNTTWEWLLEGRGTKKAPHHGVQNEK